MAVSSGIFAVPRYRCNHFVTLDDPKYYMAQLMANAPHAWEHDKSAEHWPFWTDTNLVKHVPESKIRTVTNLIMPVNEIIEAIDLWAGKTKTSRQQVASIKKAFYGTLGEQYSQFGLQPGWGDYTNVRGWKIRRNNKPDWTDSQFVNIPRVFNSLFMAIQVAVKLGYRQLRFIGVDLDQEFYESVIVFVKRWAKDAAKNGIEWVNHSPKSALREFVMNDLIMDPDEMAEMFNEMGVALA